MQGLVNMILVMLVVSTGATLYRDCAACHGHDGGGVVDGTVPAIGGQPAIVILRQLNAFRSSDRIDLRMQHFADEAHLEGAREVEAVAAYIASLRRTTAVALGDGRNLDGGASDFARNCAGCHGARGAPNLERGVPALAGQHATYLARKLREVTLADNRFGKTHAPFAARLAPERLEAIADWLARLPPPLPSP